MYHFLSKTIGLLIGPMSIIFVLWIMALLFRNKKWSRKLFISGISLLILFSNPFIANELMLWWEYEAVEKHSLNAPYESAVVFTGMLNYNKSPLDRVHFDKGSDRLFQAISLYKEGYVRKILISGGGELILQKNIQEGQKLYAYCLAIGIPKEDLILEDQAKNTYENALFSAQIIDSLYQKSEKHILITSAFHMRRADLSMQKAGYKLDCYPVDYYSHDRSFAPKYLFFPSADAIKNWERFMQELMGIIVYKLTGYI